MSHISPDPGTVLLMTARSDLGGGPRHVYDLLRCLEGSDWKTIVAAPNQQPFGPEFKRLSSQMIEIPARSFSFRTFRELVRVIQEANVSIIHSHGRGAGLYSRLLGVATKRPVLHTFHGVHAAPGPAGRVKLWIDQTLALLPFTAIFGSKAEQERGYSFKVIRGQRSLVSPNAVDLSRFPNPHHVRPQPYRIGTFLRPDHVKGPDLWLKLVSAIAMRPEFKNIQFTCAGITKSALEEFGPVPEQLEVCGLLQDPVEWLNSLSIYASSARAEGLPLGILEAMASGTPCLLSRIAAHEMFFESGTAAAFKLGDSEDFAATLSSLLLDQDRRSELAQKARRRVEEQNSLQVFRQALLRLYSDLQSQN